MNGSGKIQPRICPHCHEKIDDQRLTIHSPKLLIVEGKDEEGFFGAFLKGISFVRNSSGWNWGENTNQPKPEGT